MRSHSLFAAYWESWLDCDGHLVLILLLLFLNLEDSTRTLMIITGFVRNRSSDIMQVRRSSGSAWGKKCEQEYVSLDLWIQISPETQDR